MQNLCSPPDPVLSLATPLVQQRAAQLSDRLSLLCETLDLIFEHYPEAAKEYSLDDKASFFVERMSPFLLGLNKAGSASGSNTMEFGIVLGVSLGRLACK